MLIFHKIAILDIPEWEYKLRDGRELDPMISSSFIMRRNRDNGTGASGKVVYYSFLI